MITSIICIRSTCTNGREKNTGYRSSFGRSTQTKAAKQVLLVRVPPVCILMLSRRVLRAVKDAALGVALVLVCSACLTCSCRVLRRASPAWPV